MITEVSAHSEASMMLLADLYKAVEKGNFIQSTTWLLLDASWDNLLNPVLHMSKLNIVVGAYSSTIMNAGEDKTNELSSSGI